MLVGARIGVSEGDIVYSLGPLCNVYTVEIELYIC